MTVDTFGEISLAGLPDDAFKGLVDFLRSHPEIRGDMEEITYTPLYLREGVKHQQVCFHFHKAGYNPESLTLFLYEDKDVDNGIFVWKAVHHCTERFAAVQSITYLVEMNADSFYEFSPFYGLVDVSLAQVQAYNQAVSQARCQIFGKGV